MSIFEDEWKESGGDGLLLEGLGPIVDFNASFGNDGSDDFVQALPSSDYEDPTINPIEATLDGHTYNNVARVFPAGFEDSLSWHEDQASSCSNAIQSPYQSIELPPNSLPGHQQHVEPYPSFQHSFSRPRRSVSEPPSGLPCAGLLDVPGSQAVPQISFQRQHHFIGTPMQTHERAKPKKPPRKHAEHYKFHPYQAVTAGVRPEVRRTRTQPARGPTSVPSSPMPEQQPMIVESPSLYPHQIATPEMSPFQLISTRVCTPTPSPERRMSPLPSSCSEVPEQMTGQQSHLSIPVSMAELRGLITEAVMKALGEGKADVDVGVGAEEVVVGCEGGEFGVQGVLDGGA